MLPAGLLVARRVKPREARLRSLTVTPQAKKLVGFDRLSHKASEPADLICRFNGPPCGEDHAAPGSAPSPAQRRAPDELDPKHSPAAIGEPSSEIAECALSGGVRSAEGLLPDGCGPGGESPEDRLPCRRTRGSSRHAAQGPVRARGVRRCRASTSARDRATPDWAPLSQGDRVDQTTSSSSVRQRWPMVMGESGIADLASDPPSPRSMPERPPARRPWRAGGDGLLLNVCPAPPRHPEDLAKASSVAPRNSAGVALPVRQRGRCDGRGRHRRTPPRCRARRSSEPSLRALVGRCGRSGRCVARRGIRFQGRS